MKRISRREFAKLAGGATLAAPFVPALAARGGVLPLDEQQPTEPPKTEAKLKLTKEQEEAVKKAVERRERQLAGMRSHALPYDAEPAFVFRVRRRPQSPGKGA